MRDEIKEDKLREEAESRQRDIDNGWTPFSKDFNEETVDPVDNYWEHTVHNEYDPKCSECYREKYGQPKR